MALGPPEPGRLGVEPGASRGAGFSPWMLALVRGPMSPWSPGQLRSSANGAMFRTSSEPVVIMFSICYLTVLAMLALCCVHDVENLGAFHLF